MKETSSKHMPNHFYTYNEIIHPGFATVNGSSAHKKEKISVSNIFGWKKSKLKSNTCSRNSSSIYIQPVAYNTIGYLNNFNSSTVSGPVNYIIDSNHLNSYQSNSQPYISNVYAPTAQHQPPQSVQQAGNCHFYPSTIHATIRYLPNQKQRSNILATNWEPLSTNVQSPLLTHQSPPSHPSSIQQPSLLPFTFQHEITYSEQITIASHGNTSQVTLPKQDCTCFTSNKLSPTCSNTCSIDNLTLNSSKKEKKKNHSKFGTLMSLHSRSSDCILDGSNLTQPKTSNPKSISSSKSQSNLNQQLNLNSKLNLPKQVPNNKNSNKLSATINERFLRIFRKSIKEPINSNKSRKSILECDLTAYDLVKDKLDDCEDNNLVRKQDLCKVLKEKHLKHEYHDDFNLENQNLDLNSKFTKPNLDKELLNLTDKENLNSFSSSSIYKQSSLSKAQWQDFKQYNKKNQFNTSIINSTSSTTMPKSSKISKPLTKPTRIAGQGIKLFSSSNLESKFNNSTNDEEFYFSNESIQVIKKDKEDQDDKQWHRYDKYKNNFQKLVIKRENNLDFVSKCKNSFSEDNLSSLSNSPKLPDPDYDSDESNLIENDSFNLNLKSNNFKNKNLNRYSQSTSSVREDCEQASLQTTNLTNCFHSELSLVNKSHFLTSNRPMQSPPPPPPLPPACLSETKLSSSNLNTFNSIETNKNFNLTNTSLNFTLNSNTCSPSSNVKSILKKSISNNLIYDKKNEDNLESVFLIKKNHLNTNYTKFDQDKYDNLTSTKNYSLNENCKLNSSTNLNLNRSLNCLSSTFKSYLNQDNLTKSTSTFKPYSNETSSQTMENNSSKCNLIKPKKHVHFRSSFDDTLIVEHINHQTILEEDEPIYDDIVFMKLNKFKKNDFNLNKQKFYKTNNNLESDDSSLNSSLSSSTLDAPLTSNSTCSLKTDNSMDQASDQMINLHNNSSSITDNTQFKTGKTETKNWPLNNEQQSTTYTATCSQASKVNHLNTPKHDIENNCLISSSLLKQTLVNILNPSINENELCIENKQDLEWNLHEANSIFDSKNVINKQEQDYKNAYHSSNLETCNLKQESTSSLSNPTFHSSSSPTFNETKMFSLNSHSNRQQMSPSSSSSTSAYVSSYASSMYSSLDSSMYSSNNLKQNFSNQQQDQPQDQHENKQSHLQSSTQQSPQHQQQQSQHQQPQHQHQQPQQIQAEKNNQAQNQMEQSIEDKSNAQQKTDEINQKSKHQLQTNQQTLTSNSSTIPSSTTNKVSRAAILHCLNKQKHDKLIQDELFDAKNSKTKHPNEELFQMSYSSNDSSLYGTTSYIPYTSNELEKSKSILFTHDSNAEANENNEKSNNKIVIDVYLGNNYEFESNSQANDHIYEELECGYEREINIIENLNHNLNSMKKSIFEGASRDQILEYLEDAKERVETLINNYNEPNSLLNNKLSSLSNSCHNIRMTHFNNRRNRVSNLSNTSTDSSSSSILLVNSSSGQQLERNDSGVGTETSKSSSLDSRISKSEACLTELLDNPLVNAHSIDLDCVEIGRKATSQEEQCTDCEQAVQAELNEHLGLMYYPLLCKKCEKRRTERKEIISEFVDTEFKYGRDLRIIREEFYHPMEIANLLTRDQLKLVFLNLDELIEVNSKFSEKLQDAIDIATEQGDEDYTTVDIGKIFMEYCDMLNSFETYCIKHASASRLLNQLEKDKEILKIFLRASQMENVLLRRMNLSAFLMVPVQRVTKYPLLINRLYKVTPYHHGDRDALREAQKKVELHLEKINQQTKGTVPNKIWRRISNLSNNSTSKRSSLGDELADVKLKKFNTSVRELFKAFKSRS